MLRVARYDERRRRKSAALPRALYVARLLCPPLIRCCHAAPRRCRCCCHDAMLPLLDAAGACYGWPFLRHATIIFFFSPPLRHERYAALIICQHVAATCHADVAAPLFLLAYGRCFILIAAMPLAAMLLMPLREHTLILLLMLIIVIPNSRRFICCHASLMLRGCALAI